MIIGLLISTLSPTILRNNIGEISNIETSPHNHFVSMFKHFEKLTADFDKAELEREEILKLAKAIELTKGN